MENKVKKKQGFRINAIDIIIVAIIIAAATLIGYIFFSDSREEETVVSSSTKDIIYEVEVKQARREFSDNVQVGDTVTDAVKLYTIGEVVNVSSTPSEFVGVNEVGDGVISYYSDLTDITLRIKAKADIIDGKYMIGGYKLSVGSLVSFRTPNYTASGYCTILSEVSE